MNKMNSSINQLHLHDQKKDRQLRRHGVVTSVWLFCVLLAPVHGFHLQQHKKQLMLSSPPSSISSRNSNGTHSRRNAVRSTTTRTQLRYADFDDGDEQRRNTAGSAAGSTRRWALRDIMPSSSTHQTTATTSSSTSTPQTDEQQQENVDAYLEFLDRRYRRLHADEPSGPIGAIAPRTLTSTGPAAQRSQQQQNPPKNQQQTRTLRSDDDALLTKQSFPVLTWLLNGNPSPDKEVLSRQQQEDALYVLGVAGLASEKLLQKHHQRVRVSSTQLRADAAASASASTSTIVVETNASVVSSDDDGDVVLQSTPTTVLVKRVLVPLVRGMYIVQRRKAAMKQAVLSPVQAVIGKLWNKVQTNLQHPGSFLQSFLEVGGGRHTIMITMAIAYTAVVLVRPILQTIVTEASY